ncbi:hypothetical protein ACIO14_18015 [Nocardia fluminea]|uniref:hypothetical protein n=1 Tax=Nocardia fluminea TaxID=134984 RepID=UPI0037FD8372
MGRVRKVSKARLRQREKDQSAVEWLEWLAGMDAALGTFFAVDVPDMPVEPFTAAGLDHAERALMDKFSSAEMLLAIENAGVADRFQRFLGEAFIRSGFGGRWLNVRITDDDTDVFFRRRGFEPVICQPFTSAFLDVGSLVLGAVEVRTGHEWSWVYGNCVVDYEDWVAEGRPKIS